MDHLSAHNFFVPFFRLFYQCTPHIFLDFQFYGAIDEDVAEC